MSSTSRCSARRRQQLSGSRTTNCSNRKSHFPCFSSRGFQESDVRISKVSAFCVYLSAVNARHAAVSHSHILLSRASGEVCPTLVSHHPTILVMSSSPAASSTSSSSTSPTADYPADHPRVLIPELCRLFYDLKWVTGTGGGMAMLYNGDYYLAPSGVQKERMQPDDLFVLRDPSPEQLSSVTAFPLLPSRPVLTVASPPAERRYTPSQCTPLFFEAFTSRSASACIHTHSQAAMLVTLLFDKEFRITHQEMIKGIRVGSTAASLRYFDELVVPIIDNTPEEKDLTVWLAAAIRDYPDTNAVLVRRHGVYVWGDTWQKAKTMCECYDYLFEAAVEMHRLGIDCSQPPSNSPYTEQMRRYPNKNGQSELSKKSAVGSNGLQQ